MCLSTSLGARTADGAKCLWLCSKVRPTTLRPLSIPCAMSLTIVAARAKHLLSKPFPALPTANSSATHHTSPPDNHSPQLSAPSDLSPIIYEAFAAESLAHSLSAGRAMCLQPTAKHNSARHWAQLWESASLSFLATSCGACAVAKGDSPCFREFPSRAFLFYVFLSKNPSAPSRPQTNPCFSTKSLYTFENSSLSAFGYLTSVNT